MKQLLIFVIVGCGGTMIQPGHRALVFDSKTGLSHDVLEPGYHRVGSARVIDYDVTYSTRAEPMHLITVEGLTIDMKLAVIFRPIISELYQLETDVGPHYYDEVVGPEVRSATREVIAKHSYLDLERDGTKLEDAIEGAVRRRIASKHIEISSVTIGSVQLPPEVVEAVRARERAEQEAVRAKLELERAALETEAKWQDEKRELERDVERNQLKRAARSP